MIYDFKASGNYFKLDFDIQLEKDQQVYCFIGENGIGKTKLLQTIASVVMSRHQIILPQLGSGYLFWDLDVSNDDNHKFKLLEFYLPKNVYLNNESFVNNVGKTSIEKLQFLYRDNSEDANRFRFNKPFIFISAKNRGYIGGLNDLRLLRLDGSSTERLINTVFHTYNSIYDKEIESDSVTNWLLQRLVMANPVISGTDGLRKEVTFVLECLNKFAPELNLLKYDADNKPVINCSYENGDFYIAGIAIQNLSTGYASILRIIQEIVAGLSDWDNNVDLHNADGIVFIDEIDLHLHPKWQFKIIDLLKEFFPKVTFYITTHSPLVLFNLKNGEGYKLHKDENNLVTAKPVEQNNMQFVGDVIKQFFDVDGVSIRKTDKQSMMQARKNLLDLISENQDEQ